MDHNHPTRGWMYDRNHPNRGGIKVSFINGVDEFIRHASEQANFVSDGRMIRCPCVKCDLIKLLRVAQVKLHLYKNGFKPNYWIWTDHGEELPQSDEVLTNDNHMRTIHQGLSKLCRNHQRVLSQII